MLDIRRHGLALLLLALSSYANDNTTSNATLVSNTTAPEDELTSTTSGEKTTAVLFVAASLAWMTFRTIGIGVYMVISWMTWPVLFVLGLVWRILIVRPWELFVSFIHVVYPVALFCFAAVLCGTIIGGCAGFAAEAIAWFSITATWGRSAASIPTKRIQAAEERLQLEGGGYQDDVDDDYDDDDDTSTDNVGFDWDVKGKMPAAALEKLRERYQKENDDMYDDWAWEEDDDSIDTFPRKRWHHRSSSSTTPISIVR
ncbi:hypothetical protein O0I10_008878 [Lichtheimia ornata]|uniref:Transmembrane protein n=1 Tax=Lichtheimia ornata TaxID=688661 RepID=A0AAD7XWH8_9FUNG|nr:uncharacterized protein O0I10_008878 [Lichtheimia ornata]KAJ8655386.1 hypothetical protein O0I10_008878 [Lichtheimia ornata]